jgi:hypothetical protein
MSAKDLLIIAALVLLFCFLLYVAYTIRATRAAQPTSNMAGVKRKEKDVTPINVMLNVFGVETHEPCEGNC